MKKKLLLYLSLAFLLFFTERLSFPAAAASAGTEEEEVKSLSLIMVGDMLMHKKVVNTGLREDGSYNFDHLFAPVRAEIEKADIAIVNQETILGGEGMGGYTGYPRFNSPHELGDAEAAAGFDIILQATNHALDRGAAGIESDLAYLTLAHPELEVLGIHDSAEDQQRICILERNGIKLAVLNYTYGTNGIQMPKGKGYLVDYLSEERVRNDLAFAEANSDFTIVCPHWGEEYSLGVSADQRKWAKIFLEGGADLVIGAHPHVIEPIEWVADESGRGMLVYYSLGNFVNSTATYQKGVMRRFVGGMAKVTLRKAEGVTAIAGFGVLPLVTHMENGNVTTFFLQDYTEDMAKANGVVRQDSTFSLENCWKLVGQVWPGIALQ